jgi:phytoene synthase
MSTTAAIGCDDAMRSCAEITRRRARNFYYGLKLLPEPKRSALYVIYAWMRCADDFADESEDPSGARERIERFRRATHAALAHGATDGDPVLVALRAVAERYDLAPASFDAMLDGQLADVDGARYRTFADLRAYCERVASSVGVLCIGIWGYEGNAAPGHAIERGVAFQLTNVLRDFAEDYDRGRVYLPEEDFAAAGLTPATLRAWDDPPHCREFVLGQARRAEEFYRRSAPLDEMIDEECRPTLWAMTRIYHTLLERIQRDPAPVAIGPPVRLTTLEKGAIAIAARWRARGSQRASEGGTRRR